MGIFSGALFITFWIFFISFYFVYVFRIQIICNLNRRYSYSSNGISEWIKLWFQLLFPGLTCYPMCESSHFLAFTWWCSLMFFKLFSSFLSYVHFSSLLLLWDSTQFLQNRYATDQHVLLDQFIHHFYPQNGICT